MLKCWSVRIGQDISVSVGYDKLRYVLPDTYEQEHTMTAANGRVSCAAVVTAYTTFDIIIHNKNPGPFLCRNSQALTLQAKHCR
jgi:hypothetical protein